MPGPIFLHDDDITLRTVEREDLAFLQQYRNAPAVRRGMPRVHPENRERIEGAFEEYMSGNEGVNLVVTTTGESDSVGFVSLFDVNETSGRAELALWITPAERGNGYATAAGEVMLSYAFEERRFNRVTAGALATNAASRRVLEKLGFEREGSLREYFYAKGEYVDRIVYGLLASEHGDRSG